jgi:hypothetical protein
MQVLLPLDSASWRRVRRVSIDGIVERANRERLPGWRSGPISFPSQGVDNLRCTLPLIFRGLFRSSSQMILWLGTT